MKICSRQAPKLILTNGMSLAIGQGIGPMTWAYFVVDLDGPKKGYSRMGKDVFLFSLNVNNCSRDYMYLHPAPSKQYGFAAGGAGFWCGSNMYQQTRAWDFQADIGNSCNPQNNDEGTTGSGGACSSGIIKDGWEIADDYPWETASQKP